MTDATAPSRTVDVAPERLQRWLENFAARHGPTRWAAGPEAVVVTAADGASATCRPPFPPLRVDDAAPYAGLLTHARRDRTVGVLLVRLGGHAAGVFTGSTLTASKVGSRLVHGRSAAGGQSQKRFSRRREGQARVALQDAAAVAARVLLPHAGDLDAVVTGGDRRALSDVLADGRLAPLRRLVVERVLDVPDPRQRVLLAAPAQFRAVRIDVRDPEPASPDASLAPPT